ncbi:hypothetical protein RDWZM_000316 [Blomia tropicalis]|uniref:Uncharacterized protein n=1 Tax=Blomia tropicalis TaxID=40697 RepID=A0A9Q0RQC6_BLOTA|nr:hypothetical protein RDWZM_000316 [Blomia tropicalis]
MSSFLDFERLGFGFGRGLAVGGFGPNLFSGFGNGVLGNGNGLFGNTLLRNGRVFGFGFGNGLLGNGLIGNGLIGNGLIGNGLFGNGLIGTGLIGTRAVNGAAVTTTGTVTNGNAAVDNVNGDGGTGNELIRTFGGGVLVPGPIAAGFFR